MMETIQRKSLRGWIRLAVVAAPLAALVTGSLLFAFTKPKPLRLWGGDYIVAGAVPLVIAALSIVVYFLAILGLGVLVNRGIPWIREGFGSNLKPEVPPKANHDEG